jgi:hypothetical protein
LKTAETTIAQLKTEMAEKDELIAKLKENANTAQIVEEVTDSMDKVKVIQPFLRRYTYSPRFSFHLIYALY